MTAQTYSMETIKYFQSPIHCYVVYTTAFDRKKEWPVLSSVSLFKIILEMYKQIIDVSSIPGHFIPPNSQTL